MNRTFARRFFAAATLAAVLVFSFPPPAAAGGWGARAEWGFLARVWDWFAHRGGGSRPAAGAGGLTHLTGEQGAYIDPNGGLLTNFSVSTRP